ncbi:Uncharacterised protein [Mycobacteroides abscessus subsp. abscessus]|nr:Uncharacterised protein [Mycobacteroides abscessus subsp. abscessus]
MDTDSTVSHWSRQMKCRSHSTWKPLQMPSTGMPCSAARTTSPITGANRAMAPARR